MEEKEVKLFSCAICNLKEKFHYYGSSPSFAKNLSFPGDVYLMKDPFQPPSFNAPMNFLVLGANCALCGASVCADPACSILYKKPFCRGCAVTKLHRFPAEVQKDIERMKTADRSV